MVVYNCIPIFFTCRPCLHVIEINTGCIELKYKRGHSSGSYGHGQKQNQRCTTTHFNKQNMKLYNCGLYICRVMRDARYHAEYKFVRMY